MLDNLLLSFTTPDTLLSEPLISGGQADLHRCEFSRVPSKTCTKQNKNNKIKMKDVLLFKQSLILLMLPTIFALIVIMLLLIRITPHYR